MSTARFPADLEKASRELKLSSESEQQQIAEAVTEIVISGPPKREPRSEVPDLLSMEGFLREDSDETERPGTTALMESRQQDKRKDEELLDRLSPDE